MHANVVIAIGSDETLPDILSEIHAAGLGHNAFVLRPRRTSIQRQLTRSGIPTTHMPPRVDEAEAALVVHAAGRSKLAADITRQQGASATWIVAPTGSWDLVDDDIAASTPARTETGARPAPAPIPTTDQQVVPDETPGI